MGNTDEELSINDGRKSLPFSIQLANGDFGEFGTGEALCDWFERRQTVDLTKLREKRESNKLKKKRNKNKQPKNDKKNKKR